MRYCQFFSIISPTADIIFKCELSSKPSEGVKASPLFFAVVLMPQKILINNDIVRAIITYNNYNLDIIYNIGYCLGSFNRMIIYPELPPFTQGMEDIV